MLEVILLATVLYFVWDEYFGTRRMTASDLVMRSGNQVLGTVGIQLSESFWQGHTGLLKTSNPGAKGWGARAK